ncbi:hypothetical protein HMPREF0591_3901, partial [Mycobacterium parascrofulaceum ATCC BAA-614]
PARSGPPLSASTLVYRVLGGNRPKPCAGTRDDGARARTTAESLDNSGASAPDPI